MYGGSNAWEREAEREATRLREEKHHREMLEMLEMLANPVPKSAPTSVSTSSPPSVFTKVPTTANIPNLKGIKPVVTESGKLLYYFDSGEFFFETEDGFSINAYLWNQVAQINKDTVYVRFPVVGTVVTPCKPIVVLKGGKKNCELYAPFSGIVYSVRNQGEKDTEKISYLYSLMTEKFIEQERRQNHLRTSNGKQLIAVCDHCDAPLVFKAEDTWTRAKCIECNNKFFLRHRDEVKPEQKKEVAVQRPKKPSPKEEAEARIADIKAKNAARKKEKAREEEESRKKARIAQARSEQARRDKAREGAREKARAIAEITAENRAYFKSLDQQDDDIKVFCPRCSGHILFSVAEYGGKTIPCPHCAQLLRLPSEPKSRGR